MTHSTIDHRQFSMTRESTGRSTVQLDETLTSIDVDSMSDPTAGRNQDSQGR